MPSRQAAVTAPRTGSAESVAGRLHSAAIHLLRRLRREDDAAGISAPRLSALSVLVFGGSATIGELARAEQVRVPTMSRVVASLEVDGMVRRRPDPSDRRVVRVEATAMGRRLLHAGRRRRVAALTAEVARLAAAERRAVMRAIPLLEKLAGRETGAG